MLKQKLLSPVLAPLLRDRALSLGLGIAGVAQIVLTLTHVGGMECPVMKVFGVPCPGCGLSRACAAFLRGEVDHGLKLHAFAPVFVVLAVVFLVNGLLPASSRLEISGRIDRWERSTGIGTLALAALFLYWIVRLLYARPEVISILGV